MSLKSELSPFNALLDQFVAQHDMDKVGKLANKLCAASVEEPHTKGETLLALIEVIGNLLNGCEGERLSALQGIIIAGIQNIHEQNIATPSTTMN